MDQLKQVMAQVAKHQFWIISGLSVVLGIVGFYLIGSTLQKLYTDQQSALDQRYNDVKTVRDSLPTHPNDITKAKMDAIITKVRDDVEAAWSMQYDRQAQLLVWPEEALNNKRLVDKLKKYHPIETTLTYPNEPKDIVKTDKSAYARYFADQMPRISEIIGVEWVGEASEGGLAMGGEGGAPSGMAGMGGGGKGMGMGGMGMGGMGMSGEGGDGYGGGMNPMMMMSKDLVIWPKESQDELITSIRLWRGDTPSVYEILYTQENMWILEGIMRIIAKTNEGAKANFQTAIKEIEFIRIGKPAVGRAGVIDPPVIAQAGSGMGMMGMGPGAGMSAEEGMGMGMGMEGGAPGMGTEAESTPGAEGGMAAPVVTDPANGRYVDANFKAITGDDLRSKMQSETPEDAYFAVAKRIPVRLRFKMDQRKVPMFLANCGNAELMLEIRQVRLGDTVPAAISSSGMGMEGGMMGGKGAMGMGMGGPSAGSMGAMGGGMGGEGYGGEGGSEGGMGMPGMGGMGMPGMGGGMAMAVKPSWEMPVEVYGVIYLYNPVSIKRLGLDKVTETTEMTDTVENAAADPAATPAAGAPADPNGAANPAAANPAAPADGAPAPAADPAATAPAAPAGGTAPATPAPATPGPTAPVGAAAGAQ